jgi:hypothetical protein
MGVSLEFIDFIVPIKIIEEKYPGGWAQPFIGGRVWYDDHLFRDGAMNPSDMGQLVAEWQDLGFQVVVEKDGTEHFQDACVVEWMFGGAVKPCDWIGYHPKAPAAYLKGQPMGAIIGREDMVEHTA